MRDRCTCGRNPCTCDEDDKVLDEYMEKFRSRKNMGNYKAAYLGDIYTKDQLVQIVANLRHKNALLKLQIDDIKRILGGEKNE